MLRSVRHVPIEVQTGGDRLMISVSALLAATVSRGDILDSTKAGWTGQWRWR
jgi:hypothetical protein